MQGRRYGVRVNRRTHFLQCPDIFGRFFHIVRIEHTGGVIDIDVGTLGSDHERIMAFESDDKGTQFIPVSHGIDRWNAVFVFKFAESFIHFSYVHKYFPVK